jgi:hypothetical protein
MVRTRLSRLFYAVFWARLVASDPSRPRVRPDRSKTRVDPHGCTSRLNSKNESLRSSPASY